MLINWAWEEVAVPITKPSGNPSPQYPPVWKHKYKS